MIAIRHTHKDGTVFLEQEGFPDRCPYRCSNRCPKSKKWACQGSWKSWPIIVSDPCLYALNIGKGKKPVCLIQWKWFCWKWCENLPVRKTQEYRAWFYKAFCWTWCKALWTDEENPKPMPRPGWPLRGAIILDRPHSLSPKVSIILPMLPCAQMWSPFREVLPASLLDQELVIPQPKYCPQT